MKIDNKKSNYSRININNTIKKNNYKKANELLNEYILDYSKDIFYYKVKNIINKSINEELIEGNLREAINKFQFNEYINFELGMYLIRKGSKFEGLKYLINSIRYGKVEKEETLEIIDANTAHLDNKERKEILKYLKKSNNYNVEFPYDSKDNLVGKFFDDEYFVGINDEYFFNKSNLALEDTYQDINGARRLYVTEILKGKRKRIYSKIFSETVILPITTRESQEVIVTLNGVEYSKYLFKNRWIYIRFNKGDKIKLKGNTDLIIGDEIKLGYKEDKAKIILNIFVDGLSMKFIEKSNFENLMPRTFSFFNEGTIFNNCYVSGEWTFVGLASFFTGLYTHNHKIFHPTYNTERLKAYEVFTERLKEDGYFTSKIDGDWRSNPAYGYLKGIDRTLYSPSLKNMNLNDVIMKTIEHIEAFKETNQFIWICLPDLHDIADGYESNLSIQTKESLREKCIKSNDNTSVRQKYSDDKSKKYGRAVKRLDSYLDILYSYIKNNFLEDEFIVNLISDHGQGYLVKEDGFFLDEERTKVPLMVRGRGIQKCYSDELIQGLDLYSIILKEVKISSSDMKNDAILPKELGGDFSRDYSFAESIFPDSPYRAAIYDKEYKFFFETTNNTDNIGIVDISEYNVKLLRKSDDFDVSEEKYDLLKYYENEVLKKIMGTLI